MIWSPGLGRDPMRPARARMVRISCQRVLLVPHWTWWQSRRSWGVMHPVRPVTPEGDRHGHRRGDRLDAVAAYGAEVIATLRSQPVDNPAPPPKSVQVEATGEQESVLLGIADRGYDLDEKS